MLKINANNMVSGLEIHKTIESKNKRFDIWVKRVIEYADLEPNKDFCTKVYESTGGRPFTDYEFTLDAAKEICLLEKNSKGKQVRKWLIQISNQVENAGLVSHKQVLEIVKMIKVFSVYEHRKLALTKNVENYVSNALIIHPEYSKNTGLLYAKFHAWRNEVLKTGKDVLSQRVKEYCLIERKRIPARFTQDEALTLMGEYEQIKNAIWDLLCSQGKSEEMINNICALAQDLAKEMKPFLERLNESNLFFQKIDSNEVKGILELNQTTK
jgi:phage anti-repressor protein